jgi:hypothetical protein
LYLNEANFNVVTALLYLMDYFLEVLDCGFYLLYFR